MMNFLRKLYARMSLDDILAIVPDFEKYVCDVEKGAQSLVDKGKAVRNELQARIVEADRMQSEGNRKLAAVRKYRTITQQGDN